MDRLECIKQEVEIIKQKLLLFSSGMGGSVVLFITKSPNQYIKIGLGIIVIYTAIGVLSNIKELNKLLKEIRDLKEKL